MKSLDVAAIGTCYVDTNLPDYPFTSTGIPTEVELIGGKYEIVAGGSAVNFCRMLGSFGLKTAFIGVAGSDANGDNLEAALRYDGITPMLERNESVLTNIGFNMTNPQGEHIMLVAGTANATLSSETVLPKLQKVINDTKMIYLGGCFKLKNLAPAFGEIATLAHDHNAALVVDHGRIPQDLNEDMRESVKQLVRGGAYYLPSKDEFCTLWNVGSIEEGLQKVLQHAPHLTIVVKDGADGAWYYDSNAVQHVPAPKVQKVVDVTGAGDSFNAGFMTAVTAEMPLADAIQYACKVGAAKVAGEPAPRL